MRFPPFFLASLFAATRRYLVADLPEGGIQAQAGMVAGGFTGMLLGLAPGSSK